ncbi:hypothetical protein P153DRAFT_370429 [Dothidotthia symphoricarpi CBS 119687]|uniref:Uncharacterized protein n=1 Tax=Dothidotthia symphoricarpi CBS 119687 TaxID=1392245 RepID=A0A6A6A0P3_9PLEO|nr:uncharacterized protein P153DRAFT_370429 [Dothidotthia symphoricarpi CBS 119687]KAF2125106.1 hypothetical protein P153DRAFT_370429 [Dothidotthia symphoricarpi CBS 119687]
MQKRGRVAQAQSSSSPDLSLPTYHHAIYLFVHQQGKTASTRIAHQLLLSFLSLPAWFTLVPAFQAHRVA